MGPSRGASVLLPLLSFLAGGAATEADLGGGLVRGFEHLVGGDFDAGAICERLHSGDVRRGGTPGDFNLYILAMSWNPEWCYHSAFPGCKAPREYWEDNLTIHGLWPDYGDGTYPTVCTSEAYDHDRVVNAIGLDVLETLWPNIQVAEDAGEKYDSFWMHEWDKHGTCTGLSQEDYFSAAVSLLQTRFATPSQLTDNVGGSTTRAELEDSYGGEGMAVLDCEGRVHLNQVLLCLDRDVETGFPGKQVACPGPVIAHDDKCDQGTIEIASF